jgi:hypothetical protein
MINVDAQRFDYRRFSPSSTRHIPIEHNYLMGFADRFAFWSGPREVRVRRVTFGSGMSRMLLCMYVYLICHLFLWYPFCHVRVSRIL